MINDVYLSSDIYGHSGAVVVNYNIDGITARDPQLVLDRSVVADMFSGRITQWSDPRIVADNPNLASKLPNTTIQLIVRRDGSGTTSIFSSAMSAFSQDWRTRYGTFTTWPASLLNRTNIHPAPGNGGVYATTLAIPNSAGYVSYPYIYNQDFGLYAKMKNRAGAVVSANIQYLSAALDSVELDPRFNGQMNDLPGKLSFEVLQSLNSTEGADAFPMAGFSCKTIFCSSVFQFLVADMTKRHSDAEELQPKVRREKRTDEMVSLGFDQQRRTRSSQ